MANNSGAKKKKKKRHILLGFLIKIAVIGAAGFLLYTYVLSIYRLGNNSMFPAIRDGDLCFILKTEAPIKDDIVVWKDKNGKERLSRVVAVPKQEVEIDDQGLLVDNYAPAETIFYDTDPATEADVKYPIKLKEDEFFLLNDHREEKEDSRVFGAIKREDIVGKVFFVFRRRGF